MMKQETAVLTVGRFPYVKQIGTTMLPKRADIDEVNTTF